MTDNVKLVYYVFVAAAILLLLGRVLRYGSRPKDFPPGLYAGTIILRAISANRDYRSAYCSCSWKSSPDANQELPSRVHETGRAMSAIPNHAFPFVTFG